VKSTFLVENARDPGRYQAEDLLFFGKNFPIQKVTEVSAEEGWKKDSKKFWETRIF